MQDVIDPVVGFCQRLCNPRDAFRNELITALEHTSGLSRPVIEWGLNTTAGAWIGRTEDEASAIRAMLQVELAKPAALGAWIPSARPEQEERWIAEPLTVQILAGNVFAAAIHQMLAGLIARTGQILKPASGDVAMVELLLRGLQDIDPQLASAIAVVPFASNDDASRDEVLKAADVVTVTGSDATVAAITAQVDATNADGRGRVVHGYGHRLSAAYIGRHVWEQPATLATVAEALAVDACAYDQSGCLSPQVVFIEDCLPTALGPIAQTCFDALQRLSQSWPMGQQSTAQQLHRRTWLDQRAMEAPLPGGVSPVRMDNQVAVVTDTTSPVRPGPGGRILVIAPVGFPQGVLERLRPWQSQLGTLGVALHPAIPLKGFRQSSGLFGKGSSGEVTGPGFNRLCPIGQMQTPRIDEPHDGRPRVRLFLRHETRQRP